MTTSPDSSTLRRLIVSYGGVVIVTSVSAVIANILLGFQGVAGT